MYKDHHFINDSNTFSLNVSSFLHRLSTKKRDKMKSRKFMDIYLTDEFTINLRVLYTRINTHKYKCIKTSSCIPCGFHFVIFLERTMAKQHVKIYFERKMRK